MSRITVENDIMPRIREILPETDCVRLSYEPAECSVWDSKLGGIPYYPKDMEYPTGSGSSEGETLIFLCQLNLSELPHIKGFPDKGMLQFFISGDLDMAMPDACTTEGGYKVVYHPDIITDESLLYTEDDMPEYEIDDDMFPIHEEYLITGKLTKSLPTMDDFRFEKEVLAIIEEKTGVKLDSAFDIFLPQNKGFVAKNLELGFDDKLWETNLIREDDTPSFMGGYPHFDQNDPRRNYYEDHTVMLLQIGSVYDDDVSIEWGDGGTANFFITEKALKELDFSEVLFNWDCG